MNARLDGPTARRWVTLALTALASARPRIDALNVFPVADADTGTNVVLTLSAGARSAQDLPEAVQLAKEALAGEGVLLLSPGAPSFGAYRDYVARGRHFAELGGFDPDSITAIGGLGIA